MISMDIRRLVSRRPTRAAGAAIALACVGAMALSSPGIAASLPGAHVQAIDWDPVQTLLNQSPGDVLSVTTDSGMVVAVWSGPHFNNLWIATRPAGSAWSTPKKISTTAAALDLTSVGKGAWLIWQGFDDVDVLHVNPDGSLTSPVTVGSSSDPFIAEPHIAVGANGAVAAAWRTTDSAPAQIAYRAAGSQYWNVENVPHAGGIAGLVVGSVGTAQLVLSSGRDYRHQQLTYLRRTAGGSWRAPVTISSDASLATVAGNSDGDLVVGWQVVNNDGTFSLVARYKASDDAGFDAPHHFNDNAPYGTYVALDMGDDGALAAAYRITDSGGAQIQLTPANSAGSWLAPQTLAMTGGVYDVAANASGAYVITSEQGHGVQLVRCTAANVCGSAETNGQTGYKFPTSSLGPNGAINLVWGRGCKGEECRPTSVVAQRGR
jgi:hypothetical protein